MATRTERLEMRLSRAHKRLLERAAALSGQALSSFVLSHLVQDAREILERHGKSELSVADQRRFLEILDSDDEPAPALRAALKRAKRGRGR